MSGPSRDSATEGWARVGDLFAAARPLATGARAELLDRECGSDSELRREVEELLAADAEGFEFLDGDAASFAAPDWDASGEDPRGALEVPGYRLYDEIGRGGMSRVFVAERIDDPLHRRFALKRFASAGWGRDEMRARFRAEGRTLAALSHPNIARIYDTGADATGDPFLVMELVDGVPITAFARAEGLDLEQRITLFLDVCAAVQHAHQRLVVHRDLKPSNILVDREGRVKLLDFGIAKLLDPALGGVDPLHAPTRTGILPMTPEYAAPEQVRGEEITTATDVYGLGLLLFELLTGSRAQRVAGPGAAAVERAVCETPARRPSAAPVAEADPGAPPAPPDRWRRLLAGDLDTIVLKALRKDPAERYATAEALAEDLRRRRAGLPVLARPASFGYRARKFVGRHRVAVATAGLAALAVLALGAVALLQWREALHQRDLARAESAKAGEVVEFVLGLFAASDPNETLGEETTARQLLDRGAARIDGMATRPEVQEQMLDVLGTVYGHVGNLERAEELLRNALEIARSRGADAEIDAARIADHLAAVRMTRGDYDEAERLFRAALETRERRLGPDRPEVAASLGNLSVALKEQGDPAAAEPLLRRSLAILSAGGEELAGEAAEGGLNFGMLLSEMGSYQEAEPVLRRSREIFARLHGPVHPRLADATNALANLLARLGRYAEAEALSREALAQRRKIYGEDHTAVAQSRNDLAVLLENRGDFEAAAPIYREALASYERLVGPDHLAVAIAASNLAGVETMRERYEEAEALYRRSLAIVERQLGAVNRYAPRRLTGLGVALAGRGDPAGAEALLGQALTMARELFEAGNPAVAYTLLELGRLRVLERRAAQAQPLLVEAHETYLAALGPRHVRTARSAAWLGAALAATGERERGQALLTDALAVQRELLPRGHPHLDETEREVAALRPPPANPREPRSSDAGPGAE